MPQKELDPDLLPYERQPKESDPAWQAFKVYRDFSLETRTLFNVAKALGKSETLIGGWSVTWRWRERVNAWDREKNAAARNVELDEIAEMRKRHLKIASTMQGLGALELGKILKRARDGKDVTLTAEQMLKLVDTGIKLERLNRDQPGEINEVRTEIADMTDAQIEAQLAHLAKSLK